MNHQITKWFFLFFLVAAVAIKTQAQTQSPTKPLKVFIVADMEGVDGVVSDIQTFSKEREYEEFRQLMTQEVNAAIQGAYDAGATYVLVSDSHGSHQNIDVNFLDPRADLVRGKPEPLAMMQGFDGSFGAVALVGFHASEGTPDAIISHTFTGTMAISLNDKPVSEGAFDAAMAGDFSIPVVFLSGDQTACEQIKEMIGPIETAAVKQAYGYNVARTVAPEKARAMIRQGVKRGIERRNEIKPFSLVHPIKVTFRFKDVLNAEVVSYLPGTKRLDGYTVVFTARDMEEASRFQRAIGTMKP